MTGIDHPLRCKCGTVQGIVKAPSPLSRGVCYCEDCQMFAHFLGNSSEILDEHGGTDVIPTTPGTVVITQGLDSLACMRLSVKGLLRWYAKCCNTPIGNMSSNHKMAYIGLVHNCLEYGGVSVEQSFGPIRLRVKTQSAHGDVKLKSKGVFGTVVKFMAILLRERINGAYNKTQFFNVETGRPIVAPHVLNRQEREALRGKLLRLHE